MKLNPVGLKTTFDNTEGVVKGCFEQGLSKDTLVMLLSGFKEF